MHGRPLAHHQAVRLHELSTPAALVVSGRPVGDSGWNQHPGNPHQHDVIARHNASKTMTYMASDCCFVLSQGLKCNSISLPDEPEGRLDLTAPFSINNHAQLWAQIQLFPCHHHDSTTESIHDMNSTQTMSGLLRPAKSVDITQLQCSVVWS